MVTLGDEIGVVGVRRRLQKVSKGVRYSGRGWVGGGEGLVIVGNRSYDRLRARSVVGVVGAGRVRI